MSPRPRNIRKVFDPPKFKGFNPSGYYGYNNEPVSLLFEEYTAIKLCDYELMPQTEAAAAMNISRPTFTRLYESARRKIAIGLVDVRSIEFDKGQAYFDNDWFHCNDCLIFFNTPGPEFSSESCPVCQSKTITVINRD
jgi:predicted DNA-binding protein (UPF0251 family)